MAMLARDEVVQATHEEGAELPALRVRLVEGALLQHLFEEALHQVLGRMGIIATTTQVAEERQPVGLAQLTQRLHTAAITGLLRVQHQAPSRGRELLRTFSGLLAAEFPWHESTKVSSNLYDAKAIDGGSESPN